MDLSIYLRIACLLIYQKLRYFSSLSKSMPVFLISPIKYVVSSY